MAEDNVIKLMASIANNIVFNIDNLNILIYHILVGSYVNNPLQSREMNHQFPLIIEKILLDPMSTFSKILMIKINSRAWTNIIITQNIILIDPHYIEYLCENYIPKNIIDHLEKILPPHIQRNYSIESNYICVIHSFDNFQITCNLHFDFIPFCVSSKLLNMITNIYPILVSLFLNVLVLYFDMSGQEYIDNPLIINTINPAIYALMSNCMMNINDPITLPHIDFCKKTHADVNMEIKWYHISPYESIEMINCDDDENPNIIVFAKRYYDYFYKEHLIPLIMEIMPYIIDKYAYHITTGEKFELNNIKLNSNNMNDILDLYLLPLITYRFKSHKFKCFINWYFNNFRDFRKCQRIMMTSMKYPHSYIKLTDKQPTLLNYIQEEMMFLRKLYIK